MPDSTRSGPLGIVDIKRWRLRAGQEEDPELSPYLCALEKGERTLRRKHERSLAEQVVQELEDYEVKDGLLVKKVRQVSGQYHFVPVIPSGGSRAITWNGLGEIGSCMSCITQQQAGMLVNTPWSSACWKWLGGNALEGTATLGS